MPTAIGIHATKHPTVIRIICSPVNDVSPAIVAALTETRVIEAPTTESDSMTNIYVTPDFNPDIVYRVSFSSKSRILIILKLSENNKIVDTKYKIVSSYNIHKL